MALLTKTTSILRPNPDAGPYAYASTDEDTGELTRSLTLSRADWLDLECPVVITVTVEPGDHLNQ